MLTGVATPIGTGIRVELDDAEDFGFDFDPVTDEISNADCANLAVRSAS